MNEQWEIFVVSVLIGIVIKMLGSLFKALNDITKEMKEMRHEFAQYVTHRECEGDMALHCDQLTELFHKVNENSKDITEMKTKMDMYHK